MVFCMFVACLVFVVPVDLSGVCLCLLAVWMGCVAICACWVVYVDYLGW